MVLHFQNISVKELTLLTLLLSLFLLLAHFYLGILGIIGVLALGITALSISLLQSVKGSFLLIYFIAAVFILEAYEGIQLIELPFLALSIILLLYVLFKMLTGTIILDNALDYFFLLLHFLIPYAVILGKINGAATYTALGEVVYFLGIFTYFPLRENLQNKSFKKALAIILALTVVFVLIRNFVYYRQVLSQALLPWQAESARVAANELILVIGCSFTLVYASMSKSKIAVSFSAFLFFFFGLSLILTQSRGYWIAGFFSVIAIFTAINRKGKIRILITGSFFIISSLIIAHLVFDNFINLILNALTDRLKSIGSGSTDNSLQDRWLESKTVFSHILKNPIAGYGLGTEFTRKRIFFDFFIRTSFIHNGYLGAFFKFGILGFISFVSIWFLVIKKSRQLYKITNKAFPLAILGIVIGMLFVNNTSSQIFIFEGLAFTTLVAAYLNTELDNFE